MHYDGSGSLAAGDYEVVMGDGCDNNLGCPAWHIFDCYSRGTRTYDGMEIMIAHSALSPDSWPYYEDWYPVNSSPYNRLVIPDFTGTSFTYTTPPREAVCGLCDSAACGYGADTGCFKLNSGLVSGHQGVCMNLYYQDSDGDTYGNAAVFTGACLPPSGYVADSTDCNDSNAAVHPSATEICDGIDNDCDGQTDEGNVCVTTTTSSVEPTTTTTSVPTTTTTACAGPVWTAMSSGTTQYLNSVWGSSGSDVFAVGGGGAIQHYNGTTWSSMTSGTTAWLYAVWGSSGSDVFAVGGAGTILHYNGTTWSSMSSGTTGTIYSVWGSSGSDVFAADFGGTILHYNGTTWSAMTSHQVWGIWGSSGSDVFAVGGAGTILHYNGTTWSSMTSGTTQTLRGVWGNSPSDVFAVGYNGTLLHYNSTSWSLMTSGTTQNLFSVWGSSGSDVFAVGQAGALQHYNGTTWSSVSATTQTLTGVWGSSGSNVFAVGGAGTILHYYGCVTTTTSVPTTSAPTTTTSVSTTTTTASQGTCIFNEDCTSNYYCAHAVGVCQGQGFCEPKPEICIDVWTPVCGCDGKTYSNSCYAAREGENILYDGTCPALLADFLGRWTINKDNGTVYVVNINTICNSGQICLGSAVSAMWPVGRAMGAREGDGKLVQFGIFASAPNEWAYFEGTSFTQASGILQTDMTPCGFAEVRGPVLGDSFHIASGVKGTIYYQDADSDTYGNAAVTSYSCISMQPSGYLTNSTDCNDSNLAINPGAMEVCNGIDDDCNGLTDDGLAYAQVITECGIGACYRAVQFGCYNGVEINTCIPGEPVPETCNGIDDNCNGQTDEGCATTTTTTSCPAPVLIAPNVTGSPYTPMPTFTWDQISSEAWYNVVVWSEAAGGASSMWVGPTACSGGACSATFANPLTAGNNWWWLNIYYDEVCGFEQQPGGAGLVKAFTVEACPGPTLTSPRGVVFAYGVKPDFVFSDSGAEWYNLQAWSSAGYLSMNQWEDAAGICSAGSCHKVSSNFFPAGANWWWLNTYSTACGFQMQPSGHVESFTVTP